MAFTRNNYRVDESFRADNGKEYCKVTWKGINQTGYISRVSGPGKTITKGWYQRKKREEEEEEEEEVFPPPVSDWRDIIGDIQSLSDGYRLMIEVEGVNDARNILQMNREKWESFQGGVLLEYDCKFSDGGPFLTEGYGQVYSDIIAHEYEQPVTEMVYDEESDEAIEEFAGYETIEGDTVDVTYSEAKSNAFAIVDCSVIHSEIIEYRLILYVGDGSDWEREAKDFGEIKVK